MNHKLKILGAFRLLKGEETNRFPFQSIELIQIVIFLLNKITATLSIANRWAYSERIAFTLCTKITIFEFNRLQFIDGTENNRLCVLNTLHFLEHSYDRRKYDEPPNPFF